MVVVVQSPVLNKSPLRICVPLTSVKDKLLKHDGSPKFPTHYILRSMDYGFLSNDTIVKCEQIITLEWEKYLTNFIGKIRKGDLQEILMRMADAIGLRYIFKRK